MAPPWFTSVYSTVSGIEGYDLMSPADQVLAFDYTHSGDLDHLVLYRPGNGVIRILKHTDNGFERVYPHEKNSPGTPIGGCDLLDPNDRIIAFDYSQTGKLDHLVFYRPGHGFIRILEHTNNGFVRVYPSEDNSLGTPVGDCDLLDPNDRIIAFDYSQTGKQDHLVVYRPGHGFISILKHG
jgi:hypothetical protein